MGEVYGLTNSEIAFLEALAAHHVPFMIVGLSAAAMQGAPVVTQDIDLWFNRLDDPALRDALREAGVAYVAPQIDQPPMFAGPNLEKLDIVVNMTGLGSFDEEIKNTILLPIGGQNIPVLKLERILASKKAAGRAKDLMSIPILSDVLRVRQNMPEK
ncbi:MAG: hypothetical protein ABFD69_04540 [Candidatus Sumerlaeia bacterium]